ncbi:MAG TPA: hypothetical protein VFQ80_16100 [Thermomicrobiales bacterium]|nr:hypothetical protein [Thermomicrobiales bacterium]
MGAKRFAAARRLWDRLLREPLVVPSNPIGPFAVMTSGPRRGRRPAAAAEGLPPSEPGRAGDPCRVDADCLSGVCRRHRRGDRCARSLR